MSALSSVVGGSMSILVQVVHADGTTEDLTFQQIEFVKYCPHCRKRFETIDPDQIYPNKSHKEMAHQQRQSSLRPVFKPTLPTSQ